jgi:hypothetical protein
MTERIRVSILALSTTGAMVASLAAFAYRAYVRMDSDLRFLRPFASATVDEALIGCAMEYAQKSNDANEVMFVGASSCRCGIDPKLVRGVRSYNLGSVISFGPDGILVTARACLRRHRRPKAIVLCLSPAMLDVEPNEYTRPIRDRFLLSYGDAQSTTAIAKRTVYFVKRGAAELSPQLVSDPRNLSLEGSSETYRAFQKIIFEQRGYCALPGSRARESQSANGGPPLVIHDDWDRLVRQLAADCKSAEVRLIVRFTPVSAELDRNRDFSALEGWIRHLESSASIDFGRPTLLVYEERLMWDAIHLNRAGVERFMQTIEADVHTALWRPMPSGLSPLEFAIAPRPHLSPNCE